MDDNVPVDMKQNSPPESMDEWHSENTANSRATVERMTMDTNDLAMRTLERIALDLQGLREDVRAQWDRLDAQSERLAVQDQRSTATEASLGRMHASLEAGLERSHRETAARLERLHREVFAIGSSFTFMSERIAFATLEEAEHGRRSDERLERIDRRLERLGQHLLRVDERMGAIERQR
jgi:archaellum component FlaC